MSMNKAELIEKIAEKTSVSKKQADDMVEAFMEIVTSTLKSKGEVALTGFGTFLANARAARMGINPKNPSIKIHIPAKTVPKFKPGRNLKNALL